MLSPNALRTFLQNVRSRSLWWTLITRGMVRQGITETARASHIRLSSSSTRWKNRQGRDSFAREAKVQGLKSRAAFKLLEIDAKYRLFRKGQTVVDLGYAPGSWSQVAVERTKPNGRVIGIDIIPAQPPKGVSTIQGNFLSASVQAEVRRFVLDQSRGRPRQQIFSLENEGSRTSETISPIVDQDRSYVELERHTEDTLSYEPAVRMTSGGRSQDVSDKVVDMILSDMSAPWEQTTGFWKRSLSNPYVRMMNTSGINFKDHTASMDLCAAAFLFALDTLRTGGHFVCKFYQGAEDKQLERQLRKHFAAVYREKPESSRSESKEAYFVAVRRKKNGTIEDVYSID